MKNFIITSAVCIAMILSSASSMAQQITIVSGKVLNLPEGEKKPRPFPLGETVRIFAFNTVASARDALKALETGGGGTLLFDADAVAGADGYYEIRVAENYNPQIQIAAESGTKRSIFRQKNKTKRSKNRLHTTLIKPEQKVNEDLCSGFVLS